MAGSSKEEIARQHAEALELLKLQPLSSAAPTICEAIPLARKTRPVAERIVVQDMSVVTGPDYIASLEKRQALLDQESSSSSEAFPQPQDEDSKVADSVANADPNSENENVTKANCLTGEGESLGGALKSPNSRSAISASIKEELLPVQAWAPYWSFRGQVNIQKLQQLVQEGYNQTPTPLSPTKRYQVEDIKDFNNYWDPIHAAVRNVSIKRPSHDEWGIPKIALVFCDDFIDRVFELPWWTKQDSPFRKAVQPLLDALNVPRERVVRLLLASLPPGTTIPIHSDSGEWVRSTHRVHVPILVNQPDNILFRCGPDLQRIPTRPGYIVEINNQSWHAVSNCDSDYRVHLILDYVDEDSELPRQRLTLDEGELLRQTRRSVDRAVDVGKRPTPAFLILGAQKAGTTSLYEALMQHPWFIRPVKFRETHCLDWRWNDKLIKVENQRRHVNSFFHTKELQHYPSCRTGDSTPSYLIDSACVIPRLKRVWPHWKEMKFMVMLREPIQRCESHYAMVTSPVGTPAQLKARGSEWRESTLEQVLEKDFDLLSTCGVIPYWKDNQLDRNAFDNFINTPEEYQAWQSYLSHIPPNTGSYSLVGRSLYALNLLPWLRAMNRTQFYVINLEDWSSQPQSVLVNVWRHLDVPYCSTIHAKAQNTRDYESKLSADWKNRLQRFFEPHNERLVSLLGSSKVNPWSPCWLYSREQKEN